MPSETGSKMDFEREKWEADLRLREREIATKEREQEIRHDEVEAKVEELRRTRWINPLMLAIAAAFLAAIGNAGVALINGIQQRAQDERHTDTENLLLRAKAEADRKLEEGKAEAARILEVIKTNDPDKAATNLGFLLEAGLIVGDERRKSLALYLKNRPEGQGPALPTYLPSGPLGFDLGYVCGVTKLTKTDDLESAIVNDLEAIKGTEFGIIRSGYGGGITISLNNRPGTVDPPAIVFITSRVVAENTVFVVLPQIPLAKEDVGMKATIISIQKSIRSTLRKISADPACTDRVIAMPAYGGLYGGGGPWGGGGPFGGMYNGGLRPYGGLVLSPEIIPPSSEK